MSEKVAKKYLVLDFSKENIENLEEHKIKYKLIEVVDLD